MAPLPAGRAVAAPGRARPARDRGPGCGRGLLRRPRGRASRTARRGRSTRRSGGSGRTCWRPGSMPTRRSAVCATRHAPGCRSPRRCSTSGRWPGSATSGRTRRCGPSASRRSSRSAPLDDATLSRLVGTARQLLLASAGGRSRSALRLRSQRAAVSALRDSDRERPAGDRDPRTTYWCPACQPTPTPEP